MSHNEPVVVFHVRPLVTVAVLPGTPRWTWPQGQVHAAGPLPDPSRSTCAFVSSAERWGWKGHLDTWSHFPVYRRRRWEAGFLLRSHVS